MRAKCGVAYTEDLSLPKISMRPSRGPTALVARLGGEKPPGADPPLPGTTWPPAMPSSAPPFSSGAPTRKPMVRSDKKA